MTAADLLRRAEHRARWSRFGRLLLCALLLVLLAGLAVQRIYTQGIEAGRRLEKDAQLRIALQHSADELRLAAVHRDSTKKDAVAAVQASAVHRDSSRETVREVEVTSDTTLQVGPLPPLVLPKVAVRAFLDLREGRRRDSVAIASLNAYVRALEVRDSLWTVRDSLHERREAQLVGEAKDAERRGLWRGLKAGVVGTIVVVGTLLIASGGN